MSTDEISSKLKEAVKHESDDSSIRIPVSDAKIIAIRLDILDELSKQISMIHTPDPFFTDKCQECSHFGSAENPTPRSMLVPWPCKLAVAANPSLKESN